MIPDSPQGMNLHERIKELKKYFRHANRRPLSRKGQNFLVEQSAFEVILKEGEAGERDVVLEVGTGSGVLTSLLASRAGQVVTVEADPFLYRFSEGFLRTYGNVEHYQMSWIHGLALPSGLLLLWVGQREPWIYKIFTLPISCPLVLISSFSGWPE